MRNIGDNDPILLSFNSLLAHVPASAVGTAPASDMSSKMSLGDMIEYMADENDGLARAYHVHLGVVVTDVSSKSVQQASDPEAVRKELTLDDGEPFIPLPLLCLTLEQVRAYTNFILLACGLRALCQLIAFMRCETWETQKQETQSP